MMADDEERVLPTTPENIAILQAEVTAKRQRKADRAARRQLRARNRSLGSQEAIESPVDAERSAGYVASSQNPSQASDLAIDSDHDNTRQRTVTPLRISSTESFETLSPQSASFFTASPSTKQAPSPQSISFPTAGSLPSHTTNAQRRGSDATLPNALREGLYNERRDISPYKSTESTSSVGDDVAEIVAAGSANQDEAESTAAEEDPELENYEAPLTTKLQHLAGTLRAWTTRLTTEDALSTFLESTFWIWTQPISWFFASLFYISRRVFSKITLLWILTVFVGLVSVAVYGWVASVHASVYGWAGFILHIGPWSICKASMGNFFQTACYPEDITADVLNTFNKTYVNFDTAIATRNLISTAPIDLRNNRNSVYRDLLRLRALNVTHDVPNANFASIDSQTVIVLDLTKTIPDLLFRYLSRLASTMAVVDYQTNVTITEIASFRDGKKSSYISIPGERPYRVNAQQAVSIRFKAHVLSWQKLMKPLSEVGQALLDAIGASIDPIEGLSVSLETASSATYDSRVNIHSEWGLAKRSVYWLTGEEPAETKPLLQTRSVIGEMNGTLHHLLTWFGPMWANILSVNLGLDEILRAVDGGGILVLREGEGLELLNEMLVVFNEASARMGEGKRGLEATKMIRNFREK